MGTNRYTNHIYCFIIMQFLNEEKWMFVDVQIYIILNSLVTFYDIKKHESFSNKN